MKYISPLIAAIGLLSASNVFALSGGPFDSGDYSQTLDNAGIYQASMRFANGSGFQQWGTNVSLSPTVTPSGGGSGATAALKLGTYLDRSVVYYKGIVYVGNATGMVDHNKGTITGITNGYSTLSATSSASSGTTSTVTASTVVVNNGSSESDAVCNSTFNGKITEKAPVLTFKGTGELTVLDPAKNSTLAGSLYAALQSLIAAIPTAAVATPVPFTTNELDSVINAINTIAGGIAGINPAPDTTTNDTTPMQVFGSRVFFLSSR